MSSTTTTRPSNIILSLGKKPPQQNCLVNFLQCASACTACSKMKKKACIVVMQLWSGEWKWEHDLRGGLLARVECETVGPRWGNEESLLHEHTKRKKSYKASLNDFRARTTMGNKRIGQLNEMCEIVNLTNGQTNKPMPAKKKKKPSLHIIKPHINLRESPQLQHSQEFRVWRGGMWLVDGVRMSSSMSQFQSLPYHISFQRWYCKTYEQTNPWQNKQKREEK